LKIKDLVPDFSMVKTAPKSRKYLISIKKELFNKVKLDFTTNLLLYSHLNFAFK